MRLVKGSDRYREALFRPVYEQGMWHRFDVEPFRPTEVFKGITADAFVNDGRWLVQCPNPFCNGAQLTQEGDRKFFCVDCLNLPFDGKWLVVRWPDNHDAIESLLVKRPNPVNRNWRPGETLEDLEQENDQQGRH